MSDHYDIQEEARYYLDLSTAYPWDWDGDSKDSPDDWAHAAARAIMEHLSETVPLKPVLNGIQLRDRVDMTALTSEIIREGLRMRERGDAA